MGLGSLTISAENDGLAAEAWINDSTGFPIQSIDVPSGGSASLLLADDTDHQRLVVTSTAGSGTVAVTVRAVEPIDLAVGKETSLRVVSGAMLRAVEGRSRHDGGPQFRTELWCR